MSWLTDRLSDQLEGYEQLEDTVFADGALDAKEKRLCAVAAANIARDRGGLRDQIEAAKEAGADEDEISGALSMVWMTSGSTQIYWAEDVFEEEIEHAWYKRRLPEASKAFGEFHSAVMEDGPLPEVFMEVLGVVVGCMERCEHCTEAHIKQALDKGATKDQVAEAVGVASFIGGSSQLDWLEDGWDGMVEG